MRVLDTPGRSGLDQSSLPPTFSGTLFGTLTLYRVLDTHTRVTETLKWVLDTPTRVFNTLTRVLDTTMRVLDRPGRSVLDLRRLPPTFSETLSGSLKLYRVLDTHTRVKETIKWMLHTHTRGLNTLTRVFDTAMRVLDTPDRAVSDQHCLPKLSLSPELDPLTLNPEP